MYPFFGLLLSFSKFNEILDNMVIGNNVFGVVALFSDKETGAVGQAKISGFPFTADFYLWPAMRKFLGQDPQPTRVLARLANAFPSGGPGASAGQTGASSKLAGEVRPSETGPFYGIKQMVLHQADDGFIEACPTSSSHPGPVEAEVADAYYALKTGPGIQPPAVEDFVEVVLRPER